MFSAHIVNFGEGCFISCKKLKYVEFPIDSEMKVIDVFESGVETVIIPPSCTQIKRCYFGNCESLCYLKIPLYFMKIFLYLHDFFN